MNVFREAVQNKLRMRERVQNYTKASPTPNSSPGNRRAKLADRNKGHRPSDSKPNQSSRPSAAFMVGNAKQPHCHFCDKLNHWSTDCRTYPKPDDRRERAKQLNLCLKCLSKEHLAKDCTSKRNCYYCKKSHNSAFCFERAKTDTKPTQQPSYLQTPKHSLKNPTRNHRLITHLSQTPR